MKILSKFFSNEKIWMAFFFGMRNPYNQMGIEAIYKPCNVVYGLYGSIYYSTAIMAAFFVLQTAVEATKHEIKLLNAQPVKEVNTNSTDGRKVAMKFETMLISKARGGD